MCFCPSLCFPSLSHLLTPFFLTSPLTYLSTSAPPTPTPLGIDNWRVVRLILLAKSLKGEEVARQLIMCLSNQLGITSNQLVAAMRDSARANNVAIQTLKIVYPYILDVGCVSHTIDHVGEKIKTDILDEFVKGWIGLFTRSPKTKLAWKETTRFASPYILNHSMVVKMGGHEAK